MSKDIKVSVLINSRNRPQVLKKCIDSIMSQMYNDFEVVVLDDASDDPTAYWQMIANSGYKNIRLLHSDKQLGVAGGRNKLMSEAIGDIFCFIDDDAYFEDISAIDSIVRIFKKDKSIGIVACKVINNINGVLSFNVPFSKKVYKKDIDVLDTPQYVSYYVGTTHAIRRELFKDCGGYNKDLFFGEEEMDLSYKAINKGWRIWYEPSVVVLHFPQPSTVGEKELYHHIKNRFYLAKKYLPLKYMIFYLITWSGKYFIDAVKSKELSIYFKGLGEGFRTCAKQRERLLIKAQ